MIAPPPCTASQLSAFDAGAVPHGDRFVTTIVLVNDSTKPCAISGYPKVAFLFSNGKPESVTVRYTQLDDHGVLRLPDTIAPCSTINISPYFLSHS